MFKQPDTHVAGFTIVEMVVVITVVALLAAGATTFIRNPTMAYLDTELHASLTDKADLALRRMTREVRNALPNSVRVATNGVDSFVEFIPVRTAGRYRAEVGISPADNPLDFGLAADTFDVLGQPVSIAAGDRLVIFNLGITGSDAYEGSNIRPLQTFGSLSTLSFSGGAFPQASPSSRFYVVSTATTFVCDVTNSRLLMYSGYVMQTAQPSSIASLDALATARQLANNLTSCQISYSAGVLQRSGIVTVYLGMAEGTARVNLMHQINVVNSP
jgi:MSHA biogenesis protein MshO